MKFKLWFCVFALSGCGSIGASDKSTLVDSGTYQVTSTCNDAALKTGTLEITQKKEFIGNKIVSYTLNDGKQFGLPENNISADKTTLTSSGDERSCKSAVYRNNDHYFFLCRDYSDNVQCHVLIDRQ